MNRSKERIAVAAVALLLAACLFADTPAGIKSRWFGPVLQQVLATFRDPGTQWMVFVCCGVYFVTFNLLQHRASGARFWRLDNPDLWLSAALVLGALRYAFSYDAAVGSTYALTLLGGAVLGKGAAWATSKNKKLKAESRNRGHPTPNGGQANGMPLTPALSPSDGARGSLLAVLQVLLAVAVFLKNDVGMQFQYRGQARWSGPWGNPNVFGVLMGVGVVLAIGKILSLATGKYESRKWKAESKERKAESGKLETNIINWVKIVFLVAAASLGEIGLIKSYSRGAWLGAAAGIGFLLWNWMTGNAHLTPALSPRPTGGEGESVSRHSRDSRVILWLRHNWAPLAIILISVAVLAFWRYRDTEKVVARRAFSVGNVNDFSWRNRVSAYEGALQMMAEKPWLGFGWNQPEQVHDQYYRPPQVSEGMAIQMNDYFILGTTLGIPALAAFAAYIWLSLKRNPASSIQHPESLPPVPRHLSLPAICRAGAIVLLVGFWFDGGLFKLALAAPFWILLELGRESVTTDRHGFTRIKS